MKKLKLRVGLTGESFDVSEDLFKLFLKQNKLCRESHFKTRGCCDCGDELIDVCNSLSESLISGTNEVSLEDLGDFNEESD